MRRYCYQKLNYNTSKAFCGKESSVQHRCLNYKFIIYMLNISVPLIPSMLALFFASHNIFWIVFLSFCWLYVGCILIFEPIYYIINEREIIIVFAFKQYSIPNKEIEQITLSYDAFFNFWLVKNYVLTLDKRVKLPNRCRYIFKCAKTEKLMEQYYMWKIVYY